MKRGGITDNEKLYRYLAKKLESCAVGEVKPVLHKDKGAAHPFYIEYNRTDTNQTHAIMHFESELTSVFELNFEKMNRSVGIPPHELRKDTGHIRIFLGRSAAYAINEAERNDAEIWEESQAAALSMAR